MEVTGISVKNSREAGRTTETRDPGEWHTQGRGQVNWESMRARAGSSKDATIPEGVRIDTNRYEPIRQGEEAEE
eukprot:15132621-Heterocapsa_arctica.AAC.1